MTSLSRFARLLGLPAHQAEDALHSERAARAVLTRRSFFAASGAMAAGSCFSFGREAARVALVWIEIDAIEVEVGHYPIFAPRAEFMLYGARDIPLGAAVAIDSNGNAVPASSRGQRLLAGRVLRYATPKEIAAYS